MSTYLTTEPGNFAQWNTIALHLGLQRIDDQPWTYGIRQVSWSGHGQTWTIATHSLSGCALFLFSKHVPSDVATRPEDDRDLEQEIISLIPCETAQQVIEKSQHIQTDLQKVRQIHRLGTLLLARALPKEPILNAMIPCLLSSEPLVRWAAAKALRSRSDVHTLELLAQACQQFPDLNPTYREVEQAHQMEAEGILNDDPTDQWWILLERARQGLADGKYKRIATAMDALLQEKPDHAEGLYLRALAYEATGDHLLSFGLLSAAEAEVQLTLSVHHEDDDDSNHDEEDDDSFHDSDEFDSDFSSDANGVDDHDPEETDDFDNADEQKFLDDEEYVEQQELLHHIQEARERLEHTCREYPAEFLDASTIETFLSWPKRWENHSATRGGFAKALCGKTPGLTGIFSYIAGVEEDELSLLQKAVDEVPDAPECRFELAQDLSKNQPSSARQVYLDTLKSLNTPVEGRSWSAQQIHEICREPLTESRVLKELAHLAYRHHIWEEAKNWADQLVEHDPNSVWGWQIRANARIFGLQHEEAVVACQIALQEMNRILNEDHYFFTGSDPRENMRFNLSCVLAKVGRAREALEELRLVVRTNPKWADDARQDDYFESLWQDPDFLAITAGEETALILEEEKDPQYLNTLLDRCLGLGYLGNVKEALAECEKAVLLAELLHQPGQKARALAMMGRFIIQKGQTEAALFYLEQALELSQQEPNALRAEVVNTHAIVLQQAERLDEAIGMYKHAQDLRMEAWGKEHPYLAKSYGDLAHALYQNNAPLEEVESMLRQGIELLFRYLGNDPVPHNIRMEAEIDLCTLLSNQAHFQLESQKLAMALDTLTTATERMKKLVSRGSYLSPEFLDQTTVLAERIELWADTEHKQRAKELRHQLEILPLSCPDEEIQERLFWRRLQRLARQLAKRGVNDASFAQLLGQALRGELSAAQLRETPELLGLPNELSKRTQRYTSLLTMLALSLNTVEMGGSTIQEALTNLEELCVSSLYLSGENMDLG